MKKKFFFLLATWMLMTNLSAQETRLQGMEDVNKVTDLTLDSLDKVRQARVKPGSSRRGNNPVLFLIGKLIGFCIRPLLISNIRKLLSASLAPPAAPTPQSRPR